MHMDGSVMGGWPVQGGCLLYPELPEEASATYVSELQSED